MSYLFADKTSPEIDKAIRANTVLLLPLGQTEQHARHLQTGTDSIIAERVALAVADKLNPAVPTLVMPAIYYGYVPKVVTKWPGTFRVRWKVMADYVADVCSSAVSMGFKKLAVISAHGPHGDIARLAAREVFDRTGVGIVVTQPHTLVLPVFKKIRKSKLGGAAHACEYETSMLMHFGYPVDLTGTDARDSVKVCNEWVAGDMAGSGKVSWSTWDLQTTSTGALGDPSCASAETGKRCMEAIVEEYCRFLKYFRDLETPVR